MASPPRNSPHWDGALKGACAALSGVYASARGSGADALNASTYAVHFVVHGAGAAGKGVAMFCGGDLRSGETVQAVNTSDRLGNFRPKR